MKNIGRILLVLAIFTGAVFPQGGGTSFIFGLPQNSFKENANSNSYGATIYLAFEEPASDYPFVPGISLTFINYGKTESGPFNEEALYNLAAYHFIFQIFPDIKRGGDIRPYIETMIGGISAFSNSVDIYDWAWSIGGGAGLMFKMASHNEWGEPSDLWLDIKCRYLHGAQLEYPSEKTADTENGVFYPASSDLDLLLFNIGFTAYF